MNWITVIGLIAASCTTISFLPQVLKTIRTKNAKDLSLGMYLVFTFGVSFWLIYGVLLHDLPIIIANCITLIFTATILFYKIKYK